MTGRQKLTRRKRRVRITALAGFVASLGSLDPVAFNPPSVGSSDLPKIVGLILGLVGLATALLSLVLASGFAFRCPSCRGNLAPLVERLGPTFAVDSRIRCCPFCRADLDTDLLTGKPQIGPTWHL